MWAVVTLSPALLLWKLPSGDFVHDRYLYIPSLGLSLLVASAVARIPSGRLAAFGRPALPALATCSMVLLLVVATVVQSAHWRNGLALFSNAVKHAPSTVIARANYAIQLMANERYDEARTQFEKVLARTPDSWPAIYGIGQIHFLHGRWRDAIQSFRHAIALRPHRPEQYIHLGYALLRSGDIKGGEAAFRAAIERQPLGLGHHYALGVALIREQRWRAALAAFKRELALSPGQPDTLRRIAWLQSKLAPMNRRGQLH